MRMRPTYKGLLDSKEKPTRIKQRNTKEKAALRVAALDLYGEVCEVCGYSFPCLVRPLATKQRSPMVVHHIWHSSKGGSNEVSNAAVLCPNCHALAHVMWPEKSSEAGSVTKGLCRSGFLKDMRGARFGGEAVRQLPLCWGDKHGHRLNSTLANFQDFLVEAWEGMDHVTHGTRGTESNETTGG